MHADSKSRDFIQRNNNEYSRSYCQRTIRNDSQQRLQHSSHMNHPNLYQPLYIHEHRRGTIFFCIQYFRKSAPACQIKIEETIREQRSSFKNQLVRDKVFIGIKSTLRSCFPSYVYLMKHWKRSFINSINTKR